MPNFKERWDNLSKNVQRVIEIAVGILLAAGSGFFFTRNYDSDSFIYLLAAVALVLFIPRAIETQTGARWALMRRVMLVTLTLIVIGTFIYAYQRGIFFTE